MGLLVRAPQGWKGEERERERGGRGGEQRKEKGRGEERREEREGKGRGEEGRR